MLLRDKNYQEPSVFKPENLLREARRQKSIMEGQIPSTCILDPDGDIVEYLVRSGQAKINKFWSCYHTKMYEFNLQGTPVGIIGCAVGASFAVLLAEQMFVSGCRLLISITSAGIINPPEAAARFILIREALRDEGTSYHYLPPEEKAVLDPHLHKALAALTKKPALSVATGISWTTDSPYRETKTAIDYAKSQGVVSVEMEAAALYAFARSKRHKVVCFAHLTNNMAREGEDFEKGIENGSIESLEVIRYTIACLDGNGRG